MCAKTYTQEQILSGIRIVWSWAGVIVAFIVSFVLFIPVGVMVEFINARLNPLPEGIETFGDLARVLSAIILDQQSEAASCSTP
jgi:hypothetical protein